MTTIFESMPAAAARNRRLPAYDVWVVPDEEADRYPRRTTADLGCSALPASREVIVYRGAPNGNEH